MNYSELEHILVVERDNHTSFFTLNNESFTVGRHSSNALVLKAKVISRCHVTILPIKSNTEEVTSFWIIDGTEQGVKLTRF
jgi:pSer/pThr/pTyr-binding forkhead associated (FHA) protein